MATFSKQHEWRGFPARPACPTVSRCICARRCCLVQAHITLRVCKCMDKWRAGHASAQQLQAMQGLLLSLQGARHSRQAKQWQSWTHHRCIGCAHGTGPVSKLPAHALPLAAVIQVAPPPALPIIRTILQAAQGTQRRLRGQMSWLSGTLWQALLSGSQHAISRATHDHQCRHDARPALHRICCSQYGSACLHAGLGGTESG